MVDLTNIEKEEGQNIRVFWRADLSGFGSVKNTTPRVYLLSCPPTLLKFNIGLFTGAGACADGVAEAAGRAT